jgi:DNA-binding CsgD family transcriptional regulator
MLGGLYFETMRRLQEARSFGELAALVVERVPGVVGRGEVVVAELDAVGVVRGVVGAGGFAEQLRSRIGIRAEVDSSFFWGGLDLSQMDDEVVAASDSLGPAAYRIGGGVTRIFSAEVPSDTLAGELLSGVFRRAILCAYLEAGNFQDPDLRERFEAVLLTLRAILERIACQDAEAKVVQKVLTFRPKQTLSMFLLNRAAEVIPLSQAAVAFSERRWDRDQPMWTLDDAARERVKGVSLESWDNPVEPRWGSVELNLGRGPERMDLLPKLCGDAVLVMHPGDMPQGAAVAQILTDRQREIMGWIAEGKTSAEVGIILGISPRTVEKHLEAIFQRMGVENRIAAVRSYMEMDERTALDR